MANEKNRFAISDRSNVDATLTNLVTHPDDFFWQNQPPPPFLYPTRRLVGFLVRLEMWTYSRCNKDCRQSF
ncbi:unnamed protein product [Arabidopsis halleri]